MARIGSLLLAALGAGCAAAAAAGGAVLYAVAPGRPYDGTMKPFVGRNFAHRGLHSGDSAVPENTMPAFKAAVEKEYGIELDLQLSADGEVVVFHDDDLKRACGDPRKVCEVTFSELQKIPVFGSRETAPLFSDVLAAVGGKVPLLVELKTGKNNELLCAKTAELLDDYEGDYCVQSFDPRIVRWFRMFRPFVVRGQLITKKAEYKDQSDLTAAILSGGLMNWLARPQFINHALVKKTKTVEIAERLGTVKGCWVARSAGYEKLNDFVVFEGFRPPVTFEK